MKRAKWIMLLAAFAMPLFFAGCSDDDDDNGNGMSNHFTYDGETYSLSHGFTLFWGQWGGDGYNWDVYLMSDGIQFDDDLGDFTGNGHGIFFEFYSPEEEYLATGTYVFDEEDSGDPYTFYWADFIIDYSVETDSGTLVDIIGGVVEVERSGATYSITIQVTAEDNKPVTGYFSGPLPALDWEDFWKSEGDKGLRGF